MMPLPLSVLAGTRSLRASCNLYSIAVIMLTLLTSGGANATVPLPPTMLVRFYVLHHDHEGSHGIGDKLIQMRCVNYLGNEFFDKRASNGITSAAKQLNALRRFFADLTVTVQSYEERRREVLKEQMKLFDMDCSCEARGMLLRADADTLCQLPGTKPYILVRTDLMRWSLSLYSDRYVQHMPQFRNHTLPMVAVSIDKLGQVARQAVRKWQQKAQLYTKLVRCGLHPQLIAFEAFEDMQQLPSRFETQLLPCKYAEQRPQHLYTSVRIVHSHRISEFVTNPDEVYAHFIATPYPTFAQAFTEQANLTAAKLVDLFLA